MQRQRHSLGLAIAASLGLSAAAKAAIYPTTLVNQVSYSANGSAAANLTSSTAVWQYDDATGVVTQTGGTFNTRFVTSPTNTLFRQLITGLVIGDGAAATAESYVCQEGNFGAGVNASICGNYRLGGNFTNESTVTWGPGTAIARTLGGDDMAIGPQQSLVAYDGFTQASFAGGTLVLSNARCIPTVASPCDQEPTFVNTGYDLTFAVRGAAADSAATDLNVPTAPIDVFANDVGYADPVTVTITVPPDADGTVTITSAGADCADPCLANQADIRVVLTPSAAPATATYTETFTYQVDDGAGPPGTATVSVQVKNDAAPESTDNGRNSTGGSAADVVVLALLLGSGVLRRRRS